MWLDKRQSYQWRHIHTYTNNGSFLSSQFVCIYVSLSQFVYILILSLLFVTSVRCYFFFFFFYSYSVFVVVAFSSFVFVDVRCCTLLLTLFFRCRRRCSTYWNNNTNRLVYLIYIGHLPHRATKSNEIKWRRNKCKRTNERKRINRMKNKIII